MKTPPDEPVRVCRTDVAALLDALALYPWCLPSSDIPRVIRIGQHATTACVADIVYHDHSCQDVVMLSAYDLGAALIAVDPVYAYELPLSDMRALRTHPTVIACDTLTDEIRRQAPKVWDALMTDGPIPWPAYRTQ